MHSWELLIDHLFPLSPPEKLVRLATVTDILKEYCPTQASQTYFLSFYKRKLMKAVISTAKFSHNKKSLGLLSVLLHKWLTEQTKYDNILLVPIPLHPRRERKRGYNQVTKVLNKISLKQVKVAKKLLVRKRYTKPQTTLDKKARTKNLTGAFMVKASQINKFITKDTQLVVICDDVYTTGSTLKEAVTVLCPHIPSHCKLICLAWAH